MRFDFENWVRAQNMNVSLSRKEGVYVDTITKLMWEVWRAASPHKHGRQDKIILTACPCGTTIDVPVCPTCGGVTYRSVKK